MESKNSVIVGIGLVVMLIIAAFIVYGNNEYSKLVAKENDVSQAMIIQQKDNLIKRIDKQLKAKEAELDKVKAELDLTKKKLNDLAKGGV